MFRTGSKISEQYLLDHHNTGIQAFRQGSRGEL